VNKLKTLGPGLLYAGAAIGVSHIVQSTKAGAEYGFILISAIVLSHFFKYPFFALGPRYANLKGESLILGFRKVGQWSLVLVFLLTFTTMFNVQAAVTVVTAGLAQKLTGIELEPWQWSVILMIICFLILQIGKFHVLDNIMKLIMVVLSLTTLFAFVASFWIAVDVHEEYERTFSFASQTDTASLISFLGWMPAPLEIAIWHSIWTISKYRDQGRYDLKSENFDFKIGFYGTAVLAICFLCLGANLLYGTGIPLEEKAGKYASQLIDLYTQSIGTWAYPIIVIAAFTTMFSTTLTCFDAMPRVVREISREWFPKYRILQSRTLWMLILGTGAIFMLAYLISSMQQIITIATVASFLTAPFLAYISYRLVKANKDLKGLWNPFETRLAVAGLIFLSLFSLYYLYMILA
jgi:Mn2+/Fe2+ NRAMP family transporter